MKQTRFALAALAALVIGAGVAGCDKKEDVTNEAYKGTYGQKPCDESYKLPANIARCIQQQGRGGHG